MNHDQIQLRLGQQIQKNAKNLMPTKVRIDNGPLLKETGLRIVHINRTDDDGERSMSVAFSAPRRGLVHFATAITHPQDQFIKKLGTQTAVKNYQDGRVVTVPIPRMWQDQTAEFIKTLFAVM